MQKILYFSVFFCLILKFSSALPQEALRFPEDAFSTRGVFHNKNTPDCSSCVCGERNEEPRIVGGVMASMNAFPWIGRLTFRSSFGCGGSLINDRYLLTAAHCIRGHFWFMFRVTFGEHDRCDKSQRPFTRYLTKIISKDFSLNDLTDDIALLKLSSPVTYSHAVRPVCLPKNPERTYENTKSIVAGWGATGENQNWSCVLMEAELPVLSHKQCQRTKYNASKIHETMLCAGFPETGHKDACTGDSGGPLVSETPDHAYELIGIVSYGFGCARIGFPGVYTRVTKYLDWIQENTDDACYCREE